VLAQFVLQGGGDAEHAAAGQLQERRGAVVLGEHSDGGLERRDGLQEILLLGIELGELLLANGSGLVQRRLVLGHLLLVVLDLCVEACALGRELFDLVREVLDPGLRIRDGLRLLPVVGRAPAGHLVIDFLIFLGLLFQLRQHVLEQRNDLGHGPVLRIGHVEGQRRGGGHEEGQQQDECGADCHGDYEGGHCSRASLTWGS